MITGSIQLKNKGYIFVDIATSDEESKRLQNLAAETRFMCKTFEKTGLWLVLDQEFLGTRLLVTCLNSPIELSAEDKKFVLEECKRMKVEHEKVKVL
jgi:hypothetical protein